MDELHVPVGYTRGIKEIYFTSLRGCAGNILDGRIQMTYGRDNWERMPYVLCHELGHHIDDQIHLSSDVEVLAEYEKKAKYLDAYAKKSPSEYVGVGFETYYSADPLLVAGMRRHNRILFEKIAAIHTRYSAS
jgi:hypothetical protein